MEGVDAAGRTQVGDPYQYQSARDFFEAVRDASVEIDRTSAAIGRMRAREGLHAQRYGAPARGGRADAMRATDERMDFEARCRGRVSDDYRLLDAAFEVVYGRGGNGGGVEGLLGSAHADAVWWRFGEGAKWREVSDATGMSERWCRDAIEVALDTVDSYGLARVASGVGLAEDDRAGLPSSANV